MHYFYSRDYHYGINLSSLSKKETIRKDWTKMKKVMYTSARIRDSLIERINEILAKNSTANLVAVVERNKLFTAFIQYEVED